ncbi:MAG TPA: potassium-transporting ATPase subunit KdpC [Ktedonobacterales bacterium]|jgi:K+-transporting ATPase ATPase C chain|nr:potassium-transporting ATPase subunit KdpC [Ktedonobacterales bacterium]
MAQTTVPTSNSAARVDEHAADAQPIENGRRALLRQFRPAILLSLLLTLIAGIIYPLAVTGAAQALFPSQANGSLVYANGKPVGSSLIGQYWTQPQYFHGRPSATLNLQGQPAPYQANNSGGSNLGPTNKALVETVQQRIAELKKENPDVTAGTPIPVDMVTGSASGLDPDISVAAAYYQIPRVAKARGLSQATVQALVNAHITGRFLGLFGEPRVNVLELNLALDALSHRAP